MNIGLGIGIPFTRSSLWSNIFTPTALFMDGSTEGVWYDPSDIKLNWRRNLLTYSEQFDNAAWTKGNATVTPNTVVAPDGTLTADQLNVSVTNGGVYTSFVSKVDYLYTYSLYVKPGTSTKVYIKSNNAGIIYYVVFNLATGKFDYSPGGSGTYSIIPDNNGWFRVTVTPSAASSGTGYFEVLSENIGSIYIWGAQLEQGSTATPYQRITDGIQDYLQYQALPVLYRDAAGTLPVTAVEQPVGLMLDKSKQLVLGPELVTNGDFSNGTTGWTGIFSAVLSVESDSLKVTNSAGYGNASQAITTIVGKTYKLSIDFIGGSGITKGQIRVGTALGGSQLGVAESVGLFPATLTIMFTATGTTTYVAAGNHVNTAGAYSMYDNISVRELPGNHAFNSSGNSANFPVLSARYNVLNNTETLATQSVTTRAAKYILSFWGTGSVALSGTYTGTLVGTGADNRVYVEFTATAGTLTLTVTGSVLKAQLEEL